MDYIIAILLILMVVAIAVYPSSKNCPRCGRRGMRAIYKESKITTFYCDHCGKTTRERTKPWAEND